jgi:uncharacterized protein YdeI (YjbR/CyaY-like superfamily)
MVEIIYFERPDAFRDWLEEHHADARELLVGFYKKGTGRPSMTWPESVDEALCYGWIDGIRKRVDDERYTIRFTPRKATSTWSAVNVRRVEELTRAGRLTEAGHAAFAARTSDRTATYSYEQRSGSLGSPYEERLAANDAASRFWRAQPPSYRKAASWWVVSAKREETRQRRFAELVRLSAAGQTIPQFTRRSPT